MIFEVVEWGRINPKKRKAQYYTGKDFLYAHAQALRLRMEGGKNTSVEIIMESP